VNLAPSSLRHRLVLGAAGVGLLFAVVFGVVATWRVNHAADQAIHAALQNRLELARDEVARDGSMLQDAGSPQTDLVQVLGPDGNVRASTPALAGVGPLADIAGVTVSEHGVQTRLALQRPDIDLAVLAVPVPMTRNGDSPPGTGAVVVAVDAEGFNSAATHLLGLLIAGLSAVVLAMTALAWILTGRALSTVARITEDAEAVRPQDLAAGLPIPARDTELARLVGALNRMLARLHQSHTTELAFAADAGHRLRTPVATLRAEAELALRETDPAELTAALKRVVADADQLTSIVDRMLARSRAGKPNPEPVRDALIQSCTRWQRQAELAHVALDLRIDKHIPGETRSLELIEIVEPILDNALRHTPRGGKIDIDARPASDRDDTLVVSISNTGDPIAPDLVAHVFDAWVSSRDASVAGGLGLWLARETARDLGGDVEIVEDPLATVFRVRLPLVS
jgi:signal transduction histidine kinase